MIFSYGSNAVIICAMMKSIHPKHDVTWETYDEDMREALHRMMIENVLTDVTLVSDDQIKIQAHKIILNASSPVFQTFISSFEDLSRAVIYLKGVKYEEMRHVLDFIYLGEISIEQDKLDTFLSLSENLQLKGVNDKEMNTYSHEENIVDHNEDDEDTIKDLQGLDEVSRKQKSVGYTEEEIVLNDDAIKKYLMRVDRDQKPQIYKKKKISSDCTEENMFLHKDSINDLQEPDKKMFTDHSDTFFFFCSQCKYRAKEKSTLNIHTQVKHKHEGFRFSCKHCVWTGRKPGSLQLHMKKFHTTKLESKKGPKPKQTIFQYYGQETQETNFINTEYVSQSETESPENELDCDSIILEIEDGESAASAAACGYCGECFDNEDELNHHMVSLCVVQKLNPGVRKIVVRE